MEVGDRVLCKLSGLAVLNKGLGKSTDEQGPHVGQVIGGEVAWILVQCNGDKRTRDRLQQTKIF